MSRMNWSLDVRACKILYHPSTTLCFSCISFGAIENVSGAIFNILFVQ